MAIRVDKYTREITHAGDVTKSQLYNSPATKIAQLVILKYYLALSQVVFIIKNSS